MVRPKPRATRKMRVKRLTSTDSGNSEKGQGILGIKLVRLVTLVLKNQDGSPKGNAKPTNVSATLEEGAKTIIDRERRRPATEWQEVGSLTQSYA